MEFVFSVEMTIVRLAMQNLNSSLFLMVLLSCFFIVEMF